MLDRCGSQQLVIHAPGVHVGGGWVLLKTLLPAVSVLLRVINLDSRVFLPSALPGVRINYVRPSIISRFLAEVELWRCVKKTDTVLLFHGLPPIFPLSGRVIVFIQNRLLVENEKLDAYPLKTRFRLALQRIWLRTFSGHVQRYIVQTPTMACALRKLLGPGTEVGIKPFAAKDATTEVKDSLLLQSGFDFVYIADGEPHKNHLALLAAWRLLADSGLKPSLALTVDPVRHPQVAAEITRVTASYSLSIINFGHLPRDEVFQLYRRSAALIYPSISESFGLPLVEASQYGLAVLAPELDYVRDVVEPVQTFDPNSSLSIARAVMRFLGKGEPVTTVCSADEFVEEVVL